MIHDDSFLWTIRWSISPDHVKLFCLFLSTQNDLHQKKLEKNEIVTFLMKIHRDYPA
jgi:hypothetical protein